MRYNYFYTLSSLFKESVTRWSDRPFAQYADGSQAYTYHSLQEKVLRTVRMLERHGVDVSDKVAILSDNMPNWAVPFLAATTNGRVAVPILPGSSSSEISNILKHCGAKALFVSERLLGKLSEDIKESLDLVVRMEDLSILQGNVRMPVHYAKVDIDPDTLAAIIYTSGTTGEAKGVMLSHWNLCHNVWAAYKAQKVCPKDRWLSILPAAHTYELVLGMLLPIFAGGCIYYLKGLPTPATLLPAMKKVRPSLIMTVPLIIEKIYRSVKKKVDEDTTLTWMRRHTPHVLDFILGILLRRNTGGRLKFFGIGGAKLNPEVEAFLGRVRFPYAIGYGMTETAPLICNAAVGKTAVGTVGVPAYGVDVRLLDVNPSSGDGEVIVKGPNVMLGYYKDSERTAKAFTQDGWFRTGDLANRDMKGRYTLVGRLKNIILGSAGENIYPEEIEMLINTYPGVNESLVLEREGRLIALVHPDDGLIDSLSTKARAIREYVNERVSAFSAISCVKFIKEPFLKTATGKIRRIIYAQAAISEY